MNSWSTRLVDSRPFALVDLACAAAAGFWWYAQPGVGGWPVLIALAPWAMRLAAGRFPVKRSPFDLLVGVFLVTALVGVWAAYDPASAWAKLWVLIGAMFLYYALVAQPRNNLWLLADLLGWLGASVAVYFLLTYDWRALPRHFAALDRVGVWWMSFRPAIPGFLHPNVAGGILAMLIPFQIAIVMRAWRGRQKRLVLALMAMAGVTGVALILTSSRGAWGALAIGLTAWSVWWASRVVAQRTGWPRPLIFGFVVAVLVSAGVLVLAKSLNELVALARTVPDAQSRYELAYNTLRLITDFPYTGGGLGAFSGLYSRYMLGILVPLFTYSHNFFLDVALEQGLAGLLALVGMFAGSLALLARPTSDAAEDSLLRGAVVTGVLAVCLHGLVEDSLYGNQGTPLVLLLVGMAVALAQAKPEQPCALASGSVAGMPTGTQRPGSLVALAGAVLGTAFIGVFGSRLVGAGYADLGAVQMARIELAGWPTPASDEAPKAERLAAAQVLFESAVRFDAGNRTARYRLGLIAMQQDNYHLAVDQLQQAYRSDPGHRGVTKSLGYAYAWLGQVNPARELLVSIPEAEGELTTYAWWWKTQGHADRSTFAARLAGMLRPVTLGKAQP